VICSDDVCMQLDSDQSVTGSDGSRLRSDSYADEPPTDDCGSCSSAVFRDNDDDSQSQPAPSKLPSETNNNTKNHVSSFG